jgi:hypothetical protein
MQTHYIPLKNKINPKIVNIDQKITLDSTHIDGAGQSRVMTFYFNDLDVLRVELGGESAVKGTIRINILVGREGKRFRKDYKKIVESVLTFLGKICFYLSISLAIFIGLNLLIV